MKSVQDFSTSHPELAKDIGAGFNIVTAIPIIRGLGTVVKLGAEAGSQALKDVAVKAWTTGGPEVIGTTQKAVSLLRKNPNVFKDMANRGLVGDIKNGVFTPAGDVEKSWNVIRNSNKEIGNILRKICCWSRRHRYNS
jgi:hypothetical protein